MANEAVLWLQRTTPIPMTCDNATGIEKGAVLKIADPFTVSSADGTNDLIGGIAYTEKIANDGKTKVSVVRGPGDIFKMRISGSVNVGDPVGAIATYTNYVASLIGAAAILLSGSKVLGTALETGTNGEYILVELNIGHVWPSV